MAHFDLTRVSWPDGTVPTHANFEDLDSKTERAVNGDEGGVWAPSSAIQIGGSGLAVTGPLAAGTTTLLSGAAVQGPLTLSGAGRVIPSVTTGVDSSVTLAVATGNTVIRLTSAITSDRAYVLGITGVATNDVLTIYCEPSFVHAVSVRDQGGVELFTLGNGDQDGEWASFIYIGGWRLFQRPKGAKLRNDVVRSGDTWVCPAGVTSVMLKGYGGGGGGGGGCPGTSVIDEFPRGGGGGSGSLERSVLRAMTPGVSYTVTGGSISASGAPGLDGADGDALVFAGVTFPGGFGGRAYGITTNADRQSRGGARRPGGPAFIDPFGELSEGQGGYGGSHLILAGRGGPNQASVSADPPALGASSGSFYRGGAGGSGGAGPGGDGSVGGVGGTANNAGTGGDGHDGYPASAAGYGGAGGSGGGAGGCGSVSGGAGSYGGQGSPGQVTIIYVR